MFGICTLLVRSTMGLAVVALMLSTAAAGKDKVGRVFRCEIDGKVTYSDSVCEKAPDKKEIATGLRNSYSSGAQKDVASGKRSASKNESSGVKPKTSATGRSNTTSETQNGRQQDCKDIAAKLDEIKTRQRSRNGLSDIDESMRLADERQRFEKASKDHKCEGSQG